MLDNFWNGNILRWTVLDGNTDGVKGLPNITEGEITMNDAVGFIVSVVYPNEPPREPRKRVRGRIRYAVEQGYLAASGSDDLCYFDAAAFFDWAKGKWPELRRMEGLPTTPIIGNLNASLGAIEGGAIGVVYPKTREELEREYANCFVALTKAEARLLALEQEVDRLQSELRVYQSKEASTSDRCSAAGKLSKGVPKRER